MKWWGHSSRGVILHRVLHLSKCSTSLPCPSYLHILVFPYFAPNLMCNHHLHWYQPLVVSLCAPHHLAGVSLSTMSRDKILLFSKNSSFYLVRNYSKSFIPRNLGGSLILLPTHLTTRSILMHFLVETSCNLCCQFSKPVFESDTHKVILR